MGTPTSLCLFLIRDPLEHIRSRASQHRRAGVAPLLGCKGISGKALLSPAVSKIVHTSVRPFEAAIWRAQAPSLPVCPPEKSFETEYKTPSGICCRGSALGVRSICIIVRGAFKTAVTSGGISATVGRLSPGVLVARQGGTGWVGQCLVGWPGPGWYWAGPAQCPTGEGPALHSESGIRGLEHSSVQPG